MATILFFDDDEQVRTILSRTLQTAGHLTLESPNGKVGVAMVSQNNVDLLITDIYMPEQEGLETIVELRRERPELPIICISGGSQRSDIDFLPVAKRLGATMTLAKPIAREDPLAAVSSLLAKAGNTHEES